MFIGNIRVCLLWLCVCGVCVVMCVHSFIALLFPSGLVELHVLLQLLQDLERGGPRLAVLLRLQGLPLGEQQGLAVGVQERRFRSKKCWHCTEYCDVILSCLQFSCEPCMSKKPSALNNTA